MASIRFILKGQRYTFYALEEGSKCELLEFINGLDEKERKGLLGRMQRDADQGPPKNEEQSRNVGSGIFELKFKALRVLWFYEAGMMIVCSHGFLKGPKKTQNSEIVRAISRKDAYKSQSITTEKKGKS